MENLPARLTEGVMGGQVDSPEAQQGMIGAMSGMPPEGMPPEGMPPEAMPPEEAPPMEQQGMIGGMV